MSKHQGRVEDKIQMDDIQNIISTFVYPVDLSSFLTLPYCKFDGAGILFHVSSKEYHPTIIAQSALYHWNHYLTTNDESHCREFLAQAHWLVKHEIRIGNDSGGWMITSSHSDAPCKGSWLSAVTQGNALSVLVRAYRLTQEKVFLEVAGRAVCAFNRDILNGGVSSPIGEDGVFFEEVGVYPARHTLSGFILALLGLYDYLTLTGDAQVRDLIQKSLATMHLLLDEFDVGFWTRTDILHRQFASPTQLTLQTTLLEALTSYTGCDHCSMLVLRWRNYQCQFRSRIRYLISSSFISLGSALLRHLRSRLFPKLQVSPVLRVCVPITAFPITGGMYTILTKIAQVISDNWQLEYVTQHIGPKAENYAIHQFGGARSSPWEFPHVWLYFFSGFRKLISLMYHGSNYDVILPQDGIFTAAFAGLVGKLVGVRVVCIDHGNLVTLNSHLYRSERLHALPDKPWLRFVMKRLMFVLYWPSLYAMGWLAAHTVDHFCVPGIVGDGVEEICARFGIGPSRLTRFVNPIDIDHPIVFDASRKAEMREKNGIPANAIVITTICRLAPEKGLDIALEGIACALSELSPELRDRVHFIIAGDGPLRMQIEEDIYSRKLNQKCVLWGEILPKDVVLLNYLSDIHLYTGTRAGGYPLVILEAMASGCAVLASNVPLANEHMLAGGRGMVIPAGDAKQTGLALTQLINDPELRCRMGLLAREHVALHNTSTIFKQVWMRVTYWSALKELLKEEENENE